MTLRHTHIRRVLVCTIAEDACWGEPSLLSNCIELSSQRMTDITESGLSYLSYVSILHIYDTVAVLVS